MSHDSRRGDIENSLLVDTSKPFVFLDYGGLIMDYQFTPETLLNAHKLALRYINNTSQKQITLEQLSRAHNIEIQTYLAFRKQDNREKSLSEMIADILWELDIGEDVSREEVKGIYERNDHTAIPMPTTLESVPELKAIANLGIITNLPHSSYKLELARYGLEGVFNPIVASWEVGFRKPHPKIYEAVQNRTHVNYDELSFFSHDQEEVDGAKAVGMQGHLVKSLGEVLDKLKTSSR